MSLGGPGLRARPIFGRVKEDMAFDSLAARAARLKDLALAFLRDALASRRDRRTGALLVACLFLTGSILPIPGVQATAPSGGAGLDEFLVEMADPEAQGGVELVGDLSADERGARGLFYYSYKVDKGDTLSAIADAHNVTLDTVVSFNGIKNARSLRVGTLLKIPSMAGILYTAKAGDTADSVAAANGISAERIIEANSLPSGTMKAGTSLFLPDAKLASFTLREISGDLFSWPVRSYITSWYGWRDDPFTGARKFHNGLDIGAPMGTSVKAAMDGTVATTGYSAGLGNYVIIRHHAGWQSLYGHLKSVAVKQGQRVAVGERIAYSGNTGYSTGPHLHFSVLKNGRTVNPYNVLR